MNRWIRGGMAFVAAALAGGCLQIEARIKLHEDGSARLIERVAFSRRLLDLTGGPQGEYAKLLGRDRCLERLKGMSEGVTLVRHDIRDGEDGSRERVAEFSIPNLDGFRYVSPWLGHTDYASNSVVVVRLGPQYKQLQWSEHTAGTMEVRFEFEKGPGMPPRQGATPGTGPTPLDQQIYRDVAPVLADLMKDFRLRLTFEGYAPPAQRRLGRALPRSAEVDLLDVSHANLDSFGAGFFDDDEKMLELGRMNLAGPTLLAALRDSGQNTALPAYSPYIYSAGAGFPRGYDCIWLPPSRTLFDRHFAGRKVEVILSENRRHEKPALFDDIGWRGWEGKEREGSKPAPEGK